MTIATTTAHVPGTGWGLWRVPERCPGCAGEHLYPVFDGESSNFLCRSCHRCWYLGMGWFHRVDPETCPGCEWRSVCTSRPDEPSMSDMGREELTGEECLRLLRSQQVGRLAVMAGNEPRIYPVNYALDGEVIVFRTSPGTKLEAADHANVTFEVDMVICRPHAACGGRVLGSG